MYNYIIDRFPLLNYIMNDKHHNLFLIMCIFFRLYNQTFYLYTYKIDFARRNKILHLSIDHVFIPWTNE